MPVNNSLSRNRALHALLPHSALNAQGALHTHSALNAHCALHAHSAL